ncbi:MAG: T9SS type A sorting domain-containing protein [Bacteroidetes bacterium]|nr:T9SS type A sorting domain-containing protein [Bacteroidota bacterium]
MRIREGIFIAIVFLLVQHFVFSQSVGNYSASRSTGITYTSIVSTGSPFSGWRYSGGFSQDDNRSIATNIGFDFWYNGTRYTQISVSTNGYLDFSSSAADGGPTTGAYGYQNTRFSSTTPTGLALAPMYDDMTTQGGGDPLGGSIKYELSGSAPNRILTVEWINMAVYGNTTPNLNFQVKIYETTGVIEFIYGTMTAGTATWSYSCGINAGTISASPTTAQLLTQQTANTATFSNAVQNGLSAIPASDSKITFTPLTPANPGGSLTFTGVTSSAMTLNWANWASNEVGYAIYQSTDNITYSYRSQTAANAISSNITGLLPSTTYYWKVYAVTEGALSAALSGNQITNNAGNIVSVATGNWNTGGTWNTGVVPTTSDNVTIANGHTVTINANASCYNLTVGQGTSGILRIGSNNTARTLTVTGNVTIASGATFEVNAASNTTHIFNLTGNITNNGTFNMATDAGSLCNVTFNNNGNQTVSGSGTLTNFNGVTVNMGSSQNNMLDITSTNFSMPNNLLTLTNGTFKFSTSGTITPYTGNSTIPANGRIWINNPSATVNMQGTASLYGGIKVSAGTLNVGNATNENITSYGGSVEITGGALNIAGRLDRVNNITITSFTMSGGTLTAPTIGSTTAALAPFTMDVVGSLFSMSGGTIIIERAGAGNLGFTTSDGTFNVTDGTLQIGDASTPAGQTILVNSAVALANFTTNSLNATAQLSADLQVFNHFTVTAGALNANGFNFTVGGHWTNSGTFTPGTGTVTFNGSGTQNITKIGGETFYNLSINKSGGTLTLINDVTATNSLTQTAGNIDCGSNTLTLGTSIVSAGSMSYSTGTIIGKFKRWINATGTGISFPVGTSGYNRLTLITFTNLTSGSLTVQFTGTDPGNNGLPLADGGFSITNQFTEGYWDLTAADGLASTDYNLELTGNGFTSYTIKSSTRIIKRSASGNPWTIDGTHTSASGSTAKRTLMSGLSAQFALGNTSCSPFSASSITGSASVCTNASGEAYSVTNTTGNTYTWIITGGTQAGGGTTNSITVNWGATGMFGSVQVTETNDCGDNNTPVILPVYVNPIATSAISGLTSVAASQTGITYSVTATPGYTYSWTITGGTQASGGTSNSITVDWGAAGAGNVQVTTTRLCAGSDVVNLPVTIRSVIVSAGSGNWTTDATWVGGIAPTSADFVQIASGHTITMNGNPGACTKLTIDGTANWTAANTTNVGLSGIIINGTGDITGSVAGVLTSTGGLTLGSTLTSSTVGIVLQTTSGQSISGTGSLAKLTINVRTTNNGTLTVTGTLAGSDTLVNAAGATLNINSPVFSLTGLIANASGNTASYGSSSAQTIKNIIYYHLSLSGSGTKTLGGTTVVNGNISISGSTLDVSSSNYSLSVDGNWTNSGTFQSRFGTVTLNGSSSQAITKSGGETFNNISFSGSGTKTLANNITVIGNLTLGSVLDAGANTINIEGNWSNSGTFTSGTGTVNFNGSTQTISGSSIADFYNLNISTGAAVTLSSAQRLKGTISLNGTGTFNTNNQFTLLSTSSKTANIAALSTPANFVGNITMQRYLSGSQGYRYIGSAVGGTLSDLTPELRFDGFPGSTQPTYWCNTYTYDESVAGAFSTGWKNATNITNPLTAGKGFAVYVYSTNIPVTLDIPGSPNKGNQTLPVTYNNSGNADDGWNLVSNPYPSTIDWDASGWTRTNIQGNTYYAWNNITQNYASYPAGGPGINGGTQYIASSQAFMVKTNAAGPALNITENVKVNSEPSPSFWKLAPTPASYLSLKISGSSNSFVDETLIRFMESATVNKDADLDAFKIESTNTNVPYISSKSSDSVVLSVNSLPELNQKMSIPLFVKSAIGGSYTISVNNLMNIPADACLILKDLATGNEADIRINPYTFNLPSSPVPVNRFILHIYPSVATNIAIQEPTCNTSNDGSIVLNSPDNFTLNYMVKDSIGNTIHSDLNISQADTITGLTAGEYFITSERTDGMCGSSTQAISISEPSPLIPAITSTKVSCKGTDDGKLSLNISGGTQPYTYLWSNGSTASIISSLSLGSYFVQVTDSNNCSITANGEIIPSDDWLVADFNIDNDTLFIPAGLPLKITYVSDASFYAWDFGDGTNSTQPLPMPYSYSATGVYPIRLITSNKLCSDTVIKSIVVLNDQLTNIKRPSGHDNINIYNSGSDIIIEFKDRVTKNTVVNIYNAAGQKIVEYNEKNIPGKVKFTLPYIETGIYLVEFTSDELYLTKKILLSK